jgi:hypothetical protein
MSLARSVEDVIKAVGEAPASAVNRRRGSMRVVALVVCLLLVGVFAVQAETTDGATYSSPNGHADGLAEFLNQQECIDHNHQYVDNMGREIDSPFIASVDNIIHTPISWLQGRAKAMYDFNNKDTDSHGMGYEVGAIIQWGAGK